MGGVVAQQLSPVTVVGTLAAVGVGSFLFLRMKRKADSPQKPAGEPDKQNVTESGTLPPEQGLVLHEGCESVAADDPIASIKKAAREKHSDSEAKGVDIGEIKDMHRGGTLGPGRYLFRAQKFWQEILPEQIAEKGVEFKMGITGGKNFARIPQEYKGDPKAPAADDPALIAAAVCVPSGREDEQEVTKALRGAAGWGEDVKVRRMLARAFVTAAACSGALCESAFGGHELVVKELLRAKASPSSHDGTAKTALHMACEQGHQGTAQALLEAKADLLAKDGTGQTPCDLAREQDMGMMAKRLEKFAAAL